ncbi:MAG: phosphatase PAP2 family protein [Ignavibacteriaceae bacterium]|nr:phosphatase PAP2 family protein [Ignavibacterium sp.]MCC6255834.1 phosphatase PAP2 family protein [Ignavibacteriaceae bacterium]HMN25494.1 phosphatase PAP2 family protein [Ignavibacteriaceae bacterium]HRN25599.1 phosphatase PAP2 family protein [Ignavibacteriaceae bacterium]HRP94277.1 phosphatase PAP2 family protein [Ignavibacteriaceae bacterium]
MFFKSNKNLIAIFLSSFIIYLLSCFGLFDGLSAVVANKLYHTFGYTNKWSHTFGPPWFVGMVGNVSALGSKELVMILSTFIYFYLKLSRGKTEAKNYLFTVGTGIVLILVVKSITSNLEEMNFNTILTESLSNFPSGHAFIATVMFLSIAKYLSSRKKNDEVNKYLNFSAAIIILLVGISRFIGSGHTVTEVIAGWSLGLCWFTFAQMFLRLNHKTIFNK